MPRETLAEVEPKHCFPNVTIGIVSVAETLQRNETLTDQQPLYRNISGRALHSYDTYDVFFPDISDRPSLYVQHP